MTHILIPRTPSMNLLRPFIECPTSELDQAWAAMVRIAEVQHARAGSQCLAQIEGPAQPVLYVSPGQLANHSNPEGPESEKAGRYLPARVTPAGKFTQPLYAGAAPADGAPRARDLLGIVRTAQSEARRLINGEDSGSDLAQTKLDLPETLRVLEHALSRPAAVAGSAVGVKFFSASNEGLDEHDTAEAAQNEAQSIIDMYREEAADGWPEEVDSVCWGVILGKAVERPVKDAPFMAGILGSDMEPVDYVLEPVAAPALEAPPAVAPQGEYPHEQMDAMALARYKVVPSHASMLWSHAVVAGDGAQQLYVGREVECQNMARKFAGAFLDGAFAFHSMAAAPTAQAAPALEAPAAPAGDLALIIAALEHGQPQMAHYAEPCERHAKALAAARRLAAAPQAPAEAQEPAANLHDDGYWTPTKTEAGRALNERLMRAGSPRIPVYTHPAPRQAAPQAPNCTPCSGSGEDPEGYLTHGRGPDDHTVDGPCRSCDGTGAAPQAPAAPSAVEGVAQFRKRPVTISAIQWTGKNLREVITFTDGPPETRGTHAGMAWEAYTDLVERDGLMIYTLEGKMHASVGDWIIRGVKGEHYPCKPDIFAETYEPVAAAPAAPAVDAALNALIADVRALPTLRASEIDGEESDGTPKHWRNRPFVSLRKLELLLRDRVTASSDTALLNFIAAEYLDLRSFGMPTGQGDADVGWRVIQHHMGEPTERVVAEVYKDDPRSAIRAAIARLERDPYCTGALHEEDAAQATAKGAAS